MILAFTEEQKKEIEARGMSVIEFKRRIHNMGKTMDDAWVPYRQAVDLLLQIRSESKAKKDWATSDLIRDRLAAIGFSVKDTKDGFEWTLAK